MTLLGLLIIQLVTGYYGLVEGRDSFRWILWLHGIGAYALVVLLYWKGSIILHAVERKNRWTKPRIAFLFLLGLLLVTVAFGLAWTFYGPIYWGGFSLVSLHIYLAVPLMALMLYHAWRMRFIRKVPGALGRRLFGHTAAITLLGLIAWSGITWLRERLNLPGDQRRFTGSYERGSFSPHFPVVSWINDNPAPIEAETWRLHIRGAVKKPLELSYDDLAGLATAEQTATIDCTGGWYATQVWRGAAVADLLALAELDPEAQSVTFVSVTGYRRRFSLAAARRYLLALTVAGQPLSHGHGFPARLVAPGRRGVEWVKWIAEIRVNTTSHVWQLPLPLQ